MIERLISLIFCIKIALISAGAVVVGIVLVITVFESIYKVIDFLKTDLCKGKHKG